MTEIAASLICGDPLYIAKELNELEKAKCDYLHMDVMDGIYVDNLALGPEWIMSVKNYTSIPLDIHLACIHPKKYIDMFAPIEPEYISFHFEVTDDIVGLIRYIKSFGIKASIAINPETNIEVVYPYLELVDKVLVMTVNPGFAGQKFDKSVLKKIIDLKTAIEKSENKPKVEVDGNIYENTVSLMTQEQPDIYVLGTSGLFNQNDEKTYKERIESLRHHIDLLKHNK